MNMRRTEERERLTKLFGTHIGLNAEWVDNTWRTAIDGVYICDDEEYFTLVNRIVVGDPADCEYDYEDIKSGSISEVLDAYWAL